MAIKDMTGQRFGKLVVKELAGKDGRGECKWLCQCDCGNTTVVYGSHLRKGRTVSCGCVMRNAHASHRESRTRLYRIWQHMTSRCSNPKSDSYKYYGKRGITYCNEWKTYESFRDWAMANGYKDNLTIERIDVNGNYEPENCTWIPQTEQAKNTRKAIRITYDGITDTLRGWSKRMGIPKSTLWSAYNRGENIYERFYINSR